VEGRPSIKQFQLPKYHFSATKPASALVVPSKQAESESRAAAAAAFFEIISAMTILTS